MLDKNFISLILILQNVPKFNTNLHTKLHLDSTQTFNNVDFHNVINHNCLIINYTLSA